MPADTEIFKYNYTLICLLISFISHENFNHKSTLSYLLLVVRKASYLKIIFYCCSLKHKIQSSFWLYNENNPLWKCEFVDLYYVASNNEQRIEFTWEISDNTAGRRYHTSVYKIWPAKLITQA